MHGKYISPLTDFGFKKIFGEEANKEFLINFLNDLLPIEDKIVSINFKKNQQLGNDVISRSAVYDIFCEDEKKNQFIVEMQNARQIYFSERAVFYSTFPIQEQAKKGKWDFNLKAVYCVGILGFNLADQPQNNEKITSEYLHEVTLKDQNNNLFYDKLKYIYIELPKFTKKEEEVSTHFEKWLFFLKNLENFEEIPNILKEKVFEEAFKVAEIAKYSPETRLEYESSLKAYRDNINVIETARSEGLAKGKAEGLAKGKAEGLAKGKAEGLAKGKAEGKAEGKVQGKEETREEVAMKMIKKNMPLDLIMELTELKEEDIEKLKNKEDK